jgi:hypothetical protein
VYPALLAPLGVFEREELEPAPMRGIDRLLIADVLRDTLHAFAGSFTECAKQVRRR